MSSFYLIQIDTSRCTTIFKVIINKDYNIIKINNTSIKKNWLSEEIIACVEPPNIPLIEEEPVVIKKDSNYVKVKLCRNLVSSTSETYKAKLSLIDNSDPEDLFQPKKSNFSTRALI